MEALLIIVIIAWAIREGVQSGHLSWQSSKAANRKASRGKPVRKRAASAVQHDVGYWAHQVLNGFPSARQGLFMGWHAGRSAQLEGAAKRAQAQSEHVQARAKAMQVIREQRRRQQEILDEIREAVAAEAQPPEPPPDAPAGNPGARAWPGRGYADDEPPSPPPPGRGKPVTPPTEGTAMSGDTTYTQQMTELAAIRRDAEEEVNSVRVRRMISRLDILSSLGLDSASLSEAAAIDDALREQQKAAQQVLDAADAAITGLRQRHGGIQEAVDNSPVAQPAQPEFYQN